MERKTIAGIIAIVAVAVVVIFTGCVEEETSVSTPIATPTPEITATPSIVQEQSHEFQKGDILLIDTNEVAPNYEEWRYDRTIYGLIASVEGGEYTIEYPEGRRPTMWYSAIDDVDCYYLFDGTRMEFKAMLRDLNTHYFAVYEPDNYMTENEIEDVTIYYGL